MDCRLQKNIVKKLTLLNGQFFNFFEGQIFGPNFLTDQSQMISSKSAMVFVMRSRWIPQ